MAIITVSTNENINSMKLSGLSLNRVQISIHNSFISSQMSITESIFSMIFQEISWYLSKKKYSTHYFFPTKISIIQIVLDILFIIAYLWSFVDKAIVSLLLTVTLLMTFVLFLFVFWLDFMVGVVAASFVTASMVFDSLVVNCLSLLTKSKH